MEFNNFTDLNKKDKVQKDYIYKGKRVFPDLRTAIFANLKGYMNGSYPEPLSENIQRIGYYPLSMATEEEIAKINEIEQQVLGGKK